MRTLIFAVLFAAAACGSPDHHPPVAGDDSDAGPIPTGTGGQGTGGAAGAGGSGTGGEIDSGLGGSSGAAGSSSSGGAGGAGSKIACVPFEVATAPAFEGCEHAEACSDTVRCGDLNYRCIGGFCTLPCHPFPPVEMCVGRVNDTCTWFVGDEAIASPSPADCAAPDSGYFCGPSLSGVVQPCTPH